MPNTVNLSDIDTRREYENRFDFRRMLRMPSIVSLPNIYIIGEAGSGKGFITETIKEIYPEYQSISISDPLYSMIEYLKKDDQEGFVSVLVKLGLEHHQGLMALERVPKDIIEDIKNPLIIKSRKALQALGDIVRSFNERLLIWYAAKRVMEMNNKPVIINDVRLSFEADFLFKNLFIGIKITADKDTRINRLQNRDKTLDISTLSHRTEIEVEKIPYDYLIDNTTIIKEELVEKIRNIFDKEEIGDDNSSTILYGGLLDIGLIITVYDANFESALSFDATKDALRDVVNESPEYFSNEMLISIYHFVETGEIRNARAIISEIESRIVGHTVVSNIGYALGLFDDGFKWIDLSYAEQIEIVVKNIRKLL